MKLSVMTFVLFFCCSLLLAQQNPVDRKKEAILFKSIQKKGLRLDKKIQEAYADIATFGFLIDLAKHDRAVKIAREKNPFVRSQTKRKLKYVPLKHSIRYVKEGEDFLFSDFGKASEVRALIAKKIAFAQKNNVNVPNLNIANRDGVEVSHFGYGSSYNLKRAQASVSGRKKLSLYFTDNKTLSMAILRLENNDYYAGIKDVELIIDPSPTDDKTDDIIILYREGNKEATANLLALMHNNTFYDDRNKFKIKYYEYLKNRFVEKFRGMSNYNKEFGKWPDDSYFKRLDNGLDL